MNFIQKLFHTHEYIWETSKGNPIPMIVDIPYNKKIKVVRVCRGCGEKTPQYWGNVDGEVDENW